jgi:hypothetical protein
LRRWAIADDPKIGKRRGAQCADGETRKQKDSHGSFSSLLIGVVVK